MPVAIILSTAAVIVSESKAATAFARLAYCSSAAEEGMDPCHVRSGVLGGCIVAAILNSHVAGRGGSSHLPVSVAVGPAEGINPCPVISEEEQQWWRAWMASTGCAGPFLYGSLPGAVIPSPFTYGTQSHFFLQVQCIIPDLSDTWRLCHL